MLGLTLALALTAAPKVVSIEWNAANVNKQAASVYADSLAVALRDRGVDVVTAQDLATLIGMERQRALSGCGDEASACMTELANALGADATLVVNVTKLGSGGFLGTAKLIGSRDGKTLSAATLDAPDEATFVRSLPAAAALLASPWFTPPPVVTKSEPRKLWWLPGAIGLAAGGASAGLFVAAHNDLARIENKELDAVGARKLVTEGQALQTGGWVAAGVGGALLITSVILVAIPTTPVVPTANITSQGATVGVGGQF